MIRGQLRRHEYFASAAALFDRQLVARLGGWAGALSLTTSFVGGELGSLILGSKGSITLDSDLPAVADESPPPHAESAIVIQNTASSPKYFT